MRGFCLAIFRCLFAHLRHARPNQASLVALFHARGRGALRRLTDSCVWPLGVLGAGSLWHSATIGRLGAQPSSTLAAQPLWRSALARSRPLHSAALLICSVLRATSLVREALVRSVTASSAHSHSSAQPLGSAALSCANQHQQYSLGSLQGPRPSPSTSKQVSTSARHRSRSAAPRQLALSGDGPPWSFAVPVLGALSLSVALALRRPRAQH